MDVLARKGALVVGLAAGLVGCAEGDPCAEVGVICTIAGNGENALADPQGPATEQALSIPLDVAAGPDGRLYIADMGNFCIRDLDQATGVMSLAMGKGTRGAGGCEVDSGECDIGDVELRLPSGVAFEGGDALVIDAFGSRVLRVELASGRVTAVYGTGSRSRYSGEGGPATDAAFDMPASVVVDPAGGFFVLDQQNQVIRRVDPEGVIDRFAGGCFTGDFTDGLPTCTAADDPVACDGSDKLTCGTAENACSSVCLPDFAGDGGPAVGARFAFDFGSQSLPPRMIGTPAGELLIADTNNRRIRRIDADGIITTVAGTGEEGAGEGVLVKPYDVAVDADGTLYIADAWNDCVQALSPGGALRAMAGQCGTRGYEGDEGPATAALLRSPMGVEVAGDHLYIADTLNHVVRAVRLR